MTIHNWWISADPEWDAVFVIEGDDNPAVGAKVGIMSKSLGSVGKTIRVVEAEAVDALT